jgi:hypothetical protein
MSTNNYVDNILHSPVYFFDDIIEKLVARNFYAAKIEAKRQQIKIDTTLLSSINLVLSDLKKEEGVISRFLYAQFGFEFHKNKRREQLFYLGSELKTHCLKVSSRRYVLKRQTERLSYTIVDLERLLNQFSSKNMFFENDKIKNKSKFYIHEIEEKIGELDILRLSLLLQHNELTEIESQYMQLFKKIPRYRKIKEETYLLLVTSSKK